MDVCYATREDVKTTLDFKESARLNPLVDRAISAATEDINQTLNRDFTPWQGTRYFDWPNWQYAYPWRLWLGRDELISFTQVTAGGIDITSSVRGEPVNSGPPFRRLEVNLAGSSSFNAGASYQRSIAVTGLFGYRNDERAAGSLAAAINDTTGTTVTVTGTADIGVGSLIRVDNERMAVIERSMVTTSQTGSITASTSDVALAVANGAAFTVGEILLLDSERVRVDDIAGNTLTVRRAWDGTVLANHTAATIFALRQLTVTRGARGTTAATHSNSAPVFRHTPPDLVRELCLAEAINSLEQGSSGYSRTVGPTSSPQPAVGGGLDDIRGRAFAAYGRKARFGAV